MQLECFHRAADTFMRAAERAEAPGGCAVVGDADALFLIAQTTANQMLQGSTSAQCALQIDLRPGLEGLTCVQNPNLPVCGCGLVIGEDFKHPPFYACVAGCP